MISMMKLVIGALSAILDPLSTMRLMIGKRNMNCIGCDVPYQYILTPMRTVRHTHWRMRFLYSLYLSPNTEGIVKRLTPGIQNIFGENRYGISACFSIESAAETSEYIAV